ncbi:hypothetical protein [Winogradskyella alexanderae]|uniref:DUF4488 domain-containing protein n=1 Tax=Winogradskyella alexanderae TaxID=2877123 RepID=A0ABS7XYD3_9FLAO|nr:hypothetical protein [Winogradskyella alexanderae]MCA0133867.1 hypothetical protein [Winogradskyella alexanderae]
MIKKSYKIIVIHPMGYIIELSIKHINKLAYIMKKIKLLIFILSFISCNSDKKTSEIKTTPEKLNADLIGIYEYKTPEQSENHYIVIDTLNGKYSGLYFGTEDSGGHGVFFYGNGMENLNLENGKISFEIGKRDLYKTTRFRIVKDKRDLEKDSTSGVSKGQLKYSGEISKSGFKLNCESEFGYCWENEMNFEKLTENK